MDEGKGGRPIQQSQKDLQIQDTEVKIQEQKMDSDDLLSNQQFHKLKGSTHNVTEKEFMQKTKENGESRTEEKLEQEAEANVMVKRNVEKSAECSLLREQDLKQTIQPKVDAVHEECNELDKDGMLEPERNITMGQKVDNPGKILIEPSQNSMPKTKHDSNESALKWDTSTQNEQLDANLALQQKSELPTNVSILSSTKDSQQPCEVKDEHVKEREENDIETQQESVTPNKVSERPAESGGTSYDVQVSNIDREQQLREMLAAFFNNQNQVHQQEIKTSNQRNTYGFDNSEEIESKQLEEAMAFGELGDRRNVCPWDLGENLTESLPKFEDGVLARSLQSQRLPPITENGDFPLVSLEEVGSDAIVEYNEPEDGDFPLVPLEEVGSDAKVENNEPEDDDFPLVPSEEVGSEAEVENNEPIVLRNRHLRGRVIRGILRTLISPLSSGIHSFGARFCERHIPPERRAFFKGLGRECLLFFGGLIVLVIVAAALYFIQRLVVSKSQSKGSNVTSPLYYSHLNFNYDSFTNPVVDFDDANITNSLAVSEVEIVPAMNNLNDNVKTEAESNVVTLETNLDVTLTNFDFSVTTPFNDLEVNIMTPEMDYDFNVTNPVTDLDLSITTPMTNSNINFTTCTTV